MEEKNQLAKSLESCLICADTIFYKHLQAQICASCSAFYRRSIKLQKSFKCQRNTGKCDLTLKKNGRAICRFCRFQKCIEIGVKLKRHFNQSTAAINLKQIESPIFYDFDYIFEHVFARFQEPTLFYSNYDKLNCAEDFGKLISNFMEITKPQQTPILMADEDFRIKCLKIYYINIAQMLLAFKPFANLPLNDKIILHHEFWQIFIELGKCYQTCQYLGSNSEDSRSFADFHQFRDYKKEILENNISQNSAAAFMIPLKQKLIAAIKGFKQFNPTFFEFSIICQILLWYRCEMSAKCEICNKSFTKRGLPSHIRQKHPESSDTTIPEKPKHDKSTDVHWLDISTEDGAVISYNIAKTGQRHKGYYKLDATSVKFVETDHDETAEWFKVICKYCGGSFKRWDLRKHYIEGHLQANKRNIVLPNIFNTQSTSFAGTLPSSDSWPIDFSLIVQEDTLLKYDRIQYSSFFTTDHSFKSSNELLKCFKYDADTEHSSQAYSFNNTCPLCDEKFMCVSLNLMKLVVLVHLRVKHRDNGLLVKMCEEEIKYFNKAFGTNFIIFVDLKSGPRLPTDLLLTGPESDFIRENAYGDYDVTQRFYPCKLCLTYFFNDLSFKKHLSKVHSFTKITADYYNLTFVQPPQIITDAANINLNSSYPLAFAKDGNEYVWCCHLCGLVLRDSEAGHLLSRIGAHIISKKLSYEKCSKIYALLTQCTSYPQMKIYHETLQWNCLQYQRVFNSIVAESEMAERRCSFCSKNFVLPKLLNNESSEILHILLEHDNIGNDDLLLRYLINSDVGQRFPFLDVLFADTLEKKSKERRLRCSKCFVVFKSYNELLLHGRLHLSQHKIDPARYFFSIPAETLNIILSKLINGVSSCDKFPQYNYAVYVCTTCLQVMNLNGCNNYAQMIEHIKSCHFSEPTLPIDQLPMAFKETKFRIWIFPPSPCSSCEKQYTTVFAAKQCCTVGQPLPVFTKKRNSEKKTAVESTDKRKCDVVDFVFKTF